MVSNDLIAYMMIVATKLSGFPAISVEDYPKIEAITQEQINESQCPANTDDCRDMVAFYEHKKNTIFIRNTLDLDSTLGSSFLIHEMVHVLQYKFLGQSIYKDCQSTIRTERLAYKVQNNYLVDGGVFDRFGDGLAFMTCSENQDVDSGYVKIEPVLVK
jgi:hypothetical protein